MHLFQQGHDFLVAKGFLRKEIQCFLGACPFEKGDLGNAGKRGEDNFNQGKNLTAFPFVLRSCPQEIVPRILSCNQHAFHHQMCLGAPEASHFHEYASSCDCDYAIMFSPGMRLPIVGFCFIFQFFTVMYMKSIVGFVIILKLQIASCILLGVRSYTARRIMGRCTVPEFNHSSNLVSTTQIVGD